MAAGPGELTRGSGRRILAFDIGATKLAVALGRDNGEIVREFVSPSPGGAAFEPMWNLAIELGEKLVALCGPPDVIGVSIGGPIDSRRGVVQSPPNLPDWADVPLGSLLSQHFGVPAFVEHDAKAGALAEWLFGAGVGRTNLIFLTFGSGMGAGLIVDGRLLYGRGTRAGEVGHWRMADRGPFAYGKAGSFESFASGIGLARLAHERYPGRWPTDLTAKDLVAIARTGDDASLDVIGESATMLGRGVAYLVDLLSPEIVVLGSLAVRAGDLFLPRVQEVVDTECLDCNLPCPVVASALGEQIGTIAALSSAIYHAAL